MATEQTPTDEKKHEDKWDSFFGKEHNTEFDKKIDDLFDDYFREKQDEHSK